MKKELTVYKNELNTVPFKNFTSIEMDLFFSICTQMRDRGLAEIKYSYDELKSFSNYKDSHSKRFIKDLENTYIKMTKLFYRSEDEEEIKFFILFPNFKINKKKEYIEISTNPELQYIINSITGSFTKFELKEFTDLRSSYAKTAFRFLKQFRSTGYWKVRIFDFRELLDIPVSYALCDIDRRVIKPILEELSPIFNNLNIKKIKSKKRNKVEFLEFIFMAEGNLKK